jgi:hypothetical protein
MDFKVAGDDQGRITAFQMDIKVRQVGMYGGAVPSGCACVSTSS